MAEFEDRVNTKEYKEYLNIRDVLWLCIAKWYWFIVSIVLCLACAVYYVLSSPPVYSQSASVLIKDTSKGKSVGNQSGQPFEDFGIFTTNTNLSNEMLTMSSSSTMEEVVRRLRLDMNYFVSGRFHEIALYGTSLPIEVELLDVLNNSAVAINLDLKPSGKISLTYFELNDTVLVIKRPINGILADTLHTPLGRVVVFPSEYYSMADNMEIHVKKTTLSEAIEHYGEELSIGQSDDKACVINLRVNDVSVQRADDILATLINVYNENWVRDKNQIAISTSMFINDRLGIIESELGNVDSDISSFKSEHLIPDVESAASMYMSQASDAQQSIIKLNNEIYMARYLRNYLANDVNRNSLMPMNNDFSNGAISAQIAEYNRRLIERNDLVNKSSERNPLVVEKNSTLDEMRSVIISSIDNQIVSLNAQIKSLESVGSRATSQIASNPGQAKYLLSVERQQKVKESLYLYLLQKREENELSQAFTAYNTRIIDAPGGSLKPVAPKKIKIYAIALIIGMAIPLGTICLKEMSNTVVRGRKDIESLTIPFVGEIPEVGKKKGIGRLFGKKEKANGKGIVVKDGCRNVINEAFRVVRTNLEFMMGVHDHHIIALTSANPGSGKTFTTFNLACSLALKGKRVLAIDFDLRKGSLSKYVGRSKRGIADYMAGHIGDINEIIKKNAAGMKIDLIPVGTLPPNPTELLFSPLLPELLDTLKSHYDYVFLDCPPVEIIADAAIINQVADKTIFVIRAGVFDRTMIPEVQKLYDSGKYKNIAILLNGTDVGIGKYGSRYGYRYGYSYGYGN